VQYRVGGRLPLHSTAVGLVLLAFAPSGLQEDFLARPMYGEPDHVLIPPKVMCRTLADVRRERLAVYRRQEQEVIVAVAAPIFGADDSVAAALGVLLPERVAPPRRLGLAVRTAAQGISRELLLVYLDSYVTISVISYRGSCSAGAGGRKPADHAGNAVPRPGDRR